MLHVKGNPLIPISIQHADGTIVEIGHNVPWSSLGFPHLDIPYVVDIRKDTASGNVYAVFEIDIDEHEKFNDGDIIHTMVDIRDIDEFAEYDTPEQCKVVYNMLVDKHWG